MEWITVGEPDVQRQRGKWVVRQGGYDPVTGRRRVKQLATLPTKRAATAFRASVIAGRTGTETETIAGFLSDVWLPSKQGRIEASSLDQYAWAVRCHIVPLIGAVRLGDLTPEVADEWVTALTAPDKRGKPRLGSTSARLVRKILSMAMEEAVQRGRVARHRRPVSRHCSRMRFSRPVGNAPPRPGDRCTRARRYPHLSDLTRLVEKHEGVAVHRAKR